MSAIASPVLGPTTGGGALARGGRQRPTPALAKETFMDYEATRQTQDPEAKKENKKEKKKKKTGAQLPRPRRDHHWAGLLRR